MTYATKADMLERYAESDLRQLTDRDPPYSDAIVDAVLDRALADADEEIDAYLRPRYRLPLSASSPVLTRIACRLAYHGLHRNLPSEEVAKARAEALMQLGQIRDGKLDLGLDAIEPAERVGEGARHEAAPRVFTPDSLEGF